MRERLEVLDARMRRLENVRGRSRKAWRVVGSREMATAVGEDGGGSERARQIHLLAAVAIGDRDGGKPRPFEECACTSMYTSV